MADLLRVEDLSASYGSNEVLHHLNFSLPQGGLTAVVGPSGCGKSTLLHTLNGMLADIPGASWQGLISLQGQNCRDLPREDLRRRMGLVFQKPTPFPFSIERNLNYALRYYGLTDRTELKARGREALQLVGLYDEVKDKLSESALTLSGGQQQRLCIARALTVQPEILLLDEPTSALDVQAMSRLEALFRDMKSQYTLVLVTHNLGQARRLADRLLVLNEGMLIEDGPCEQLFTEAQNALTRAFLSGIYG